MKEIRKIAGSGLAGTVDNPAFHLAGLLCAPAFYMLVAALAAIASASGLLIRSTRRVDSPVPQERPR